MSDLYSEILKVSIEELYQDEYYSIPLTKHQITTVMDLLHENGETSLLMRENTATLVSRIGMASNRTGIK